MSAEDDDVRKLRQFVFSQDEQAFTALVRSKIAFVHSAALRQVGGNEHMAREVTQTVFTELVRHAPALSRGSSLTGWLYVSTRFAARNAWRKERRWRDRQEEGNHMQELNRERYDEHEWEEIRPILDKAMSELNEADRAAVLSRYFEGRSVGEIAAQTGLAENTARMRIARALDRLRARLERRGIRSTAAALSAVLTSKAVAAAPAGLAESVASGSVVRAALAGAGPLAAWRTAEFIIMKKITLGLASALLVAGGATVWMIHSRQSAPAEAAAISFPASSDVLALRKENRALRAENAQLRLSALAGASNAKPAEPAGLDKLQWLAAMKRQGILETPVPVMDGRGKVDPKFADLFHLTPAEASAMQAALDSARTRLNALAQANAKVVEDSPNRFVLSVTPFPEEGGQVYDETFASLARVLGSEREAIFLALSANQFEGEFQQFGAAPRTVTLTKDPNAPGAPVKVVEQWSFPDQGGTSRGVSDYPLANADHATRLGFGSFIPARFLPAASKPSP